MAKRSTTLHQKLVKKVLNNPESKASYTAFKLHLDIADKLKLARQKAHLTQEKVAKKMGTSVPTVARIEAAGGKDRHSPTLLTLLKYAESIGKRLEISLLPATHQRHR